MPLRDLAVMMPKQDLSSSKALLVQEDPVVYLDGVRLAKGDQVEITLIGSTPIPLSSHTLRIPPQMEVKVNGEVMPIADDFQVRYIPDLILEEDPIIEEDPW